MGPTWPSPTVDSIQWKLNKAGQFGQEDRASGSSSWKQCGDTPSGKNVASTPEPYYSVSPAVFNFKCPRGAHCRFRLDVANCPHCRIKLSRQGYWGLGKHIKTVFHCGWHWLNRREGSEHYASPKLCSCTVWAMDQNLWGRHALKIPALSSIPFFLLSPNSEDMWPQGLGKTDQGILHWGWCWRG